MNFLDNYLKNEQIIFYRDYDFTESTYSKIGAIASYYIIPDTLDKAFNLISNLIIKDENFKIIGEVSNLLFLDYVKYNIIISTKLLNRVIFDKDDAFVECGKKLEELVRSFSCRSISGFEGLEGIPGSLGGAILMNAGAYGYNVSDHLIEVHCIDGSGNKLKLGKEDCNFQERSSIFKYSDLIILGARFKCPKGVYEEIESKIKTFHHARHLYLEYSFPNLGSIFALPTSDIYEYILPKQFFRRIFYKVIIRIYSSRFFNSYRRKNPSRKLHNSFLFPDYKNLFSMNLHSNKTINTFAYKKNGSITLLNYFLELKKELPGKVKLENEIFDDNISEILNQHDYESGLSLIASLKEGND